MKNLIYVVAMLAMILFLMWAFSYALTPKDLTQYEQKVTYTVEKGDTLWNIVAHNCFSSTEVRNHYDIREVIELVRDWNDVGNYIYPGDTLVLPYYTK